MATRTWQHGTTTTGSNGVGTYHAATAPGDVVVVAGGYAEAKDYSGSNTSSTDTTGNTAFCPLVGIRSWYDSVSNVTRTALQFSAPPNTTIVVHTLITY